jgi:hypothetical protein
MTAGAAGPVSCGLDLAVLPQASGDPIPHPWEAGTWPLPHLCTLTFL